MESSAAVGWLAAAGAQWAVVGWSAAAKLSTSARSFAAAAEGWVAERPAAEYMSGSFEKSERERERERERESNFFPTFQHLRPVHFP